VPDSNEESLNHRIAVEEAREPFPEEAEEPSARRRARSYFQQHPGAKWLLLFLFLAIVLGGILIWRYYAARESTDDAQIDAHIAPISARVGGTVIAVNVDDNQLVKKGQVLVQLDPKDYEVALAQAKANLADAVAGHRAAQTAVPIAPPDVRPLRRPGLPLPAPAPPRNPWDPAAPAPALS